MVSDRLFKIDESYFVGCLVGLAVGDAVGTTLEFKKPGTFTPLIDMIGGGPFNLNVGEWTDDTSMALCLAKSLIEHNGSNPLDQMQRYWQWYMDGYMSSNGRCFDIGNTTIESLRAFESYQSEFAGDPDPRKAGNGSIMRLAPVPMFYAKAKPEIRLKHVRDSSRTTHAAADCIDSCLVLSELIVDALNGVKKDELLFRIEHVYPSLLDTGATATMLRSVDWRRKKPLLIGSGGYSVSTLKTALWAFATTGNFKAAILKAANLGEDADTNAAVTGQIAGAYYGEQSIPDTWKQKLHMYEEIAQMARDIFRLAHSAKK